MKKTITTRNEKLGNVILKRLQINDEITRINNEKLPEPTNSNVKNACIVEFLADLMNSRNKSFFNSFGEDQIYNKITESKKFYKKRKLIKIFWLVMV